MEQIQKRPTPEILRSLAAHPAATNASNMDELKALVQHYPQCSIFHLLLAKAAQSSEAEIAAKTLQTAAVHVADREVLFKLIHQPDLLVAAKPEQIFPPVEASEKAETLKPNTSFVTVISLSDENEVLVSAETVRPIKTDTSFTNENLVSEEQPKQVEAETGTKTDASFTNENLVHNGQLTTVELETGLKPEEAMAVENDLRVEDVNLNFVNTDAGLEQSADLKPEQVLVEEMPGLPTITNEPVEESPLSTNTSFTNEIDEEVFEEIMAIEDMRFDAIKTARQQGPETPTKVEIEPEVHPQPEIKAEVTPAFTLQDKAEKDMLSSIASIDYFTFNNKFGQNQTPSVQDKAELSTKPIAENQETTLTKPEQSEQETVSKYHDDKMPYTFMWWLDRTRKAHAGTYQPYIKNQQKEKPENGLSVGPELHQQYIESIFHTKPPHGLVENNLPQAIDPPVKRKEDDLIERFIIKEPHIHPPSNDKLDTENKAKKSSEDADALVTETLAKIYLDQMLYHKALETYKKLLLKFPEKNLYFTSQIELIENKIN